MLSAPQIEIGMGSVCFQLWTSHSFLNERLTNDTTNMYGNCIQAAKKTHGELKLSGQGQRPPISLEGNPLGLKLATHQLF